MSTDPLGTLGRRHLIGGTREGNLHSKREVNAVGKRVLKNLHFWETPLVLKRNIFSSNGTGRKGSSFIAGNLEKGLGEKKGTLPGLGGGGRVP